MKKRLEDLKEGIREGCKFIKLNKSFFGYMALAMFVASVVCVVAIWLPLMDYLFLVEAPNTAARFCGPDWMGVVILLGSFGAICVGADLGAMAVVDSIYGKNHELNYPDDDIEK